MKQLKACVAIDGVAWWNYNAANSGKSITLLDYDAVMFCDVSLQGYGCKLGHKVSGSWWTKTELDRFGSNINALELLAVLYAIKSFTSEL